MKEGFIVGKGNYCAVPYGNQLMVIHNGEQLKVCRTEASARKFIDDHKKGKSQAKLPVDYSYSPPKCPSSIAIPVP